jgi:pantoate--beta-alanine ligase
VLSPHDQTTDASRIFAEPDVRRMTEMATQPGFYATRETGSIIRRSGIRITDPTITFPGQKSMTLDIVRTVLDLRGVVAGWRKEGCRVAVVPTMGALHEGHLSLVRTAFTRADRVIATIFVNPKQFNNSVDLANYPRTDVADAALLTSVGTHLLYMPDGDVMYPDGFATTVSVAGISEGLCGAHRPGHFDGVATVVTKLLLQTGADTAFFGEKDFQQLRVIQRLVQDLDIPTEIVPCPTVREADGLAMSSRNARLSPADREKAPRLAEILFAVAGQLATGVPAEPAIDEATDEIVAAGFDRVDYLELRSVADLTHLPVCKQPARLLVAAWLGDIRLIDNVAVLPERRSRS